MGARFLPIETSGGRPLVCEILAYCPRDGFPAVDEAEAGPPPRACRACDRCHLATAAGKRIKVCPCHTAYYCSVECQRASWAEHKPACKRARREEKARRRREAEAAAKSAGPPHDCEDPD